MRRVLNVILATTVLGSTAWAQVAVPRDVTNSSVRFNTQLEKPVSSFTLIPAIAIGGGGLASVSSRLGVQINQRPSSNYEGGVLAEFGRGTFVFQTGLMYMAPEAKLGFVSSSESGSVVHDDLDIAPKYLGVPIAAKARFRVANGFRLAARLGVVPMILTGAEKSLSESVDDGFGRTTNLAGLSASGTEGLRAVNVAAVVGFGPELKIARDQNVRLEANYERMLLPLEISGSTETIIHTWNAMLSYGVAF